RRALPWEALENLFLFAYGIFVFILLCRNYIINGAIMLGWLIIQLQTRIYYDDESSVLLGNYNELISYNEIKPVISESVKMTWSYLIQFEDKKIPEKQEIELMIISTPLENIIEDNDVPIFRFNFTGEFRISIKHTARSWGSDIEALLTNQINSIIVPCEKWRGFIMKKSGAIGLLAGLFFLISTIITTYFITANFNKEEIDTTSQFVQNSANDSIQKIDFLIGYIAKNSQNFMLLKGLCFIVISSFTAIIFGIWVESLAGNKTKSYLTLTREAEKAKNKSLKEEKRKTILFFISIIIEIVVGVITSYLFVFLSRI
ncbi:MAG: hypothetical protein WA055_00080, partial [Candidatus Moraniibacteriota bacterium]